jgi:DDE superfamily endonuclease
MLLWIEKPTVEVCAGADVRPVRFYCGRKKKYGLNFMATCDDKCRFLDIEIRHPGSASDYLAFATSNLKVMLEEPGFLAPGLVIFGDNAYSNTQYMVTPYKGNVSVSKDAFNFYHLQLRIQIECAFGRLVHCWGIL